MKELRLRYNGFENQLYSFSDENGRRFNFSKIRAELIREFQLTSAKNRNQFFNVQFFVASSEFTDTYIVSDMRRA